MSNPYPWINDSQYLIPPVTGYLAVTSPNGLYMVDPNNSNHYTAFGIDTLNLNGTIYNWSSIVAGGGSTPSLAQVLTIGNSAGSSSINMNTQPITDISTATAKTSVVVDNAVAGQNATVGTGNLTINNSVGTGVATSLLTLNQTLATGGILYTEKYNQKTASTTPIYQESFYAQTTNNLKREYARVSVDTPTFTNNFVSTARYNIDLRSSGGAMTTYLSCNSQTAEVNSFRTLNMNTFGIKNITDATTVNNSFLAPQKVDYFTTNGNIPSTQIDLNMRYVAVNGISPSPWIQSSANNFGSVENITASLYSFAGAWWVGTEFGNLYYSTDNGASWILQYSFQNGRINCLTVFRNGSRLAVGGAFSGNGYEYLAGVDLGFNTIDITLYNGSNYNGLNGEVLCFCNNSADRCLYVGGNFTDFNNGGGLFKSFNFLTLDYVNFIWYDFSGAPNSGFKNGVVRSISIDSNSGIIIVGGDFTDIYITGSYIGFPIPYLFTWNTLDGITVNSYFSIGFNLDNRVTSLLDYNGNGTLVGGDFTNTNGAGSSSTTYGIRIFWNGGGWDIFSYPLLIPSAPITYITQPAGTGDIFTILGSTLYRDVQILPNIPVGSVWNNVGFNGSSYFFATDNQTGAGFIYYALNQSSAVNLTSAFSINGYQINNATTCSLLAPGSSVELIFINGLGSWFILSQQGCTFF